MASSSYNQVTSRSEEFFNQLPENVVNEIKNWKWLNKPVCDILFDSNFRPHTENVTDALSYMKSHKYPLHSDGICNRGIGDEIPLVAYVLYDESLEPNYQQIYGTLFTSCAWRSFQNFADSTLDNPSIPTLKVHYNTFWQLSKSGLLGQLDRPQQEEEYRKFIGKLRDTDLIFIFFDKRSTMFDEIYRKVLVNMTVLNRVVVCAIRDEKDNFLRSRMDEFGDILQRLATLNVPPISYMANNYSLWCIDSGDDGVILTDELSNVLCCSEISSKNRNFY